MPEVGSQPRATAKNRMPMIATQNSGALAPASEVMLAIRSKTPPGTIGGKGTDHQGQGDHNRHCQEGEHERRRKGFERDLESGASLSNGFAEITLGKAFDELRELHDQRLIEAVAFGEFLPGFERRVDRQKRLVGSPVRRTRKKTRMIRPTNEKALCNDRLLR